MIEFLGDAGAGTILVLAFAFFLSYLSKEGK